VAASYWFSAEQAQVRQPVDERVHGEPVGGVRSGVVVAGTSAAPGMLHAMARAATSTVNAYFWPTWGWGRRGMAVRPVCPRRHGEPDPAKLESPSKRDIPPAMS
jgi:hypothetical protein